MKIKDGASVAGLDIRMRPALVTADAVWKQFGQELVVTSGLDGEHDAGSLHYYGLAVDLRTRFFTDEEKHLVAMRLKEKLGNSFDVVIRETHVHVEYDF